MRLALSSLVCWFCVHSLILTYYCIFRWEHAVSCVGYSEIASVTACIRSQWIFILILRSGRKNSFKRVRKPWDSHARHEFVQQFLLTETKPDVMKFLYSYDATLQSSRPYVYRFLIQSVKPWTDGSEFVYLLRHFADHSLISTLVHSLVFCMQTDVSWDESMCLTWWM